MTAAYTTNDVAGALPELSKAAVCPLVLPCWIWQPFLNIKVSDCNHLPASLMMWSLFIYFLSSVHFGEFQKQQLKKQLYSATCQTGDQWNGY